MSSLPRLPDWVPGAEPVRGGVGRMPVSRINAMARDERTRSLTVAGAGKLVRVLLGRRDLPGEITAVGTLSGDLVLRVEWCLGEIEEIEQVWINDEPLPQGVTITHYTGTPTQGVDPTLESAIAAYADTMRIETPWGMRGVAYSSIRIPANALGAAPRSVRCVAKGLKLYDPRTETTAYSDSSALAFGACITDPVWGAGLEVYGLAEAADWADDLLGGVLPRARLALVIQQARPVYPDWFDLFAELSECYYTLRDRGVQLIPDAPVDLETTPIVTPDVDIIASDDGRSTLRLVAEDGTRVPTEVEVLYTVPGTDGKPWGTEPVPRSLPGVNSGERPRIPTSVRLEAVYRPQEANNKALARLNRLYNRVTVSWMTRDYGIEYLKGTVLRVHDAEQGITIPVRVEDAPEVEPGRYHVTGLRYDEQHYPSELALPEDTTTLPVGAILPLFGAGEPADGWELVTEGAGRFVRVAGGAHAVGAEGGEAGFGGWQILSSTDALHPTTSPGFPTRQNEPGGSLTGPRPGTSPGPMEHNHELTIAAFDPNLYRRHQRFVRKTGTPAITIPPEIGVFGVDGLPSSVVQRDTSFAGRLIVLDESSGNAGVQSLMVQMASEHKSLNHIHQQFFSNTSTEVVFQEEEYSNVSDGSHDHGTPTVAVQRSIDTYRIGLYRSDADYPVVPGMVIGWEDMQNIPADWAAFTPAQDKMLAFAGSENAHIPGDNTLSISGSLPPRAHSHRGSTNYTGLKRANVPHLDVPHDHDYEASTPWLPLWRAGFSLIQYAPGG